MFSLVIRSFACACGRACVRVHARRCAWTISPVRPLAFVSPLERPPPRASCSGEAVPAHIAIVQLVLAGQAAWILSMLPRAMQWCDGLCILHTLTRCSDSIGMHGVVGGASVRLLVCFVILVRLVCRARLALWVWRETLPLDVKTALAI
jgi:hypothetical protein